MDDCAGTLFTVEVDNEEEEEEDDTVGMGVGGTFESTVDLGTRTYPCIASSTKRNISGDNTLFLVGLRRSKEVIDGEAVDGKPFIGEVPTVEILFSVVFEDDAEENRTMGEKDDGLGGVEMDGLVVVEDLSVEDTGRGEE